MNITDYITFAIRDVVTYGLLIPAVISLIYHLCKNARQKHRRQKGLEQFKDKLVEIAGKNPNYDVLCSNVHLKKNYFVHSATNYQFVIPFPKSKEKELDEIGFKPVKLNGEIMQTLRHGEEINQNLKRIIHQNGIPEAEIDDFITRIAEETADKFVKDINKGKVRFNKYLYGVRDRAIKKSECEISVYESDYFTFKTVTNIYNELKKRKKKRKKDVIIQNSWVPLLNSIGVGGFVIINRGEGDELIWGYRGSNCQSGGYWHFSYDETFTRDDSSKTDINASITGCIKRALNEELGFNPDELDKCLPESQITVIDGGIIHTDGKDNRYEFELCSFVRVCLSSHYTFDDFIENYRFAKDAELETRCLMLVKLTELDEFFEKYKRKISPESKALAMKIKCMADLGILPSDEDGYRELFPFK